MAKIKTIVFDIGGVLIAWSREEVYLKIFNGDTEKTNWFLNNVCTLEWNHQMDKGITFDDAISELQKEWPEYTNEIKAYKTRWEEMVIGEITPTVNILKRLKALNYPLYALTNFSHEKIEYTKNRFKFLDLFDGIVVSGLEKIAKPEAEFFNILLERYNLDPSKTLFIDDCKPNIKTAEELGFENIWFKNPNQLKEEMTRKNIF